MSEEEIEAAREFRVMSLGSVTFDLPHPTPQLNLTEDEAPWRPLVIPIALPEALSIAQVLYDERAPRPNTHDAFASFLVQSQSDVIAARITRLDQGVFFAELDVMTPRGRVQIECRPSDAIAMALRQTVPAPILCDRQVLETLNV